ncbi:hydroxymethylbilane synthase [Eudoraea chungangensis]|uniref:hydroxymethylbilane synthase n=1 Tax=Eudoraea chungangensis TaxID=1481905 RepID=UPI0023EAD304|nr:hydroxymethylbilane synthase [Eudoraea chungangensis]
MSQVIRIGTRDSALAIWQAQNVQNQLQKKGYKTVLIPVKSDGDLELNLPLYDMGITGIFTKTLDVALLTNKIDLAVHSMKDVPTRLPLGVQQTAVLKRGNPRDLIVHKGLDFLNGNGLVATGSLRRKAQWLKRYPKHEVVNLRGNVNTRLKKFKDNNWDAAIFATAGLQRIDVLPENHKVLNWMVPAPAQGIVMIASKIQDEALNALVKTLNDPATEVCAKLERDFLRELEGGCTAPIGALASISGNEISFEGILLSLDGRKSISIKKSIPASEAENQGIFWAQEALQNGGKELMQEVKEQL